MSLVIPLITVQEPSPIEPPFAHSRITGNPSSQSLGHRASRVEQWVDEQQVQDDEDATDNRPREETQNHPYLTYPRLGLWSLRAEQSDYILVNKETGAQDNASTLHTPPQSPKRAHGIFNPTSPLRNFRFPLSTPRRSTAALKPSGGSSHSRGSSLPVFNPHAASSPMLTESPTRKNQSHWNVTCKFKRPSVLSHFPAATPDKPEIEKPRPSSSSNGSYSTRPSLDASSYPSTKSSPFHKSSPSLWSLPSSASHLNDPPGSTKLISQTSRSTIRVPFSIRSSFETPSIHASSILSGPRPKRKRYLVISGINMDDEIRYEAVKEWCESFGEIKSITRAPNSDIHVDFRKNEVADTVCRVQARVNIAGVGSVGLSWHTGRRF